MATPRSFWPQSPAGRRPLWYSLAAMSVWVILPIITMTFRETFPITDTWVMPVIGVIAMSAAGIYNLIAVTRDKHRSVVNIVFCCITVGFALFALTFVVGEGLAGV